LNRRSADALRIRTGPTAEDLFDDERATLRRLNRLDVELYAFAAELFDAKVDTDRSDDS
jgi:hypothetical protein